MLAVWLGVGAVVGAGGAVLVRQGPWWSAALVHYAIPYVLLTVVIGSVSRDVRAAVARASSCFVAFVIAYYAVVAVQFGSIPVFYAAAWFAAALTICPAAAVLVRVGSRRGGLPAALVFASAGAVVLSDGSVGNVVRAAFGGLDSEELQPVTFSTAVVGLGVALVIVLAFPRDRWTRLLAVALLVPFAVVSTYAGWVLHFGVGPYLAR